MKCINRLLLVLTSVTFSFVVPQASAEEAKKAPNPNFSYLMEGKPVEGWTIQLTDPGNWYNPIQGQKGASATKKVIMEPTDFRDTGDAIKLTWTTKSPDSGNFAITGNPIDLSSVENLIELSFVIRVDKRPNKEVDLSMDCGYPCKSSVHLTNTLMKLKMNEWTTFAVPLNCIKKDKLDTKKISGPVSISTDGKLGISIADIRMQKMPDGEKGCLGQEEAQKK